MDNYLKENLVFVYIPGLDCKQSTQKLNYDEVYETFYSHHTTLATIYINTEPSNLYKISLRTLDITFIMKSDNEKQFHEQT